MLEQLQADLADLRRTVDTLRAVPLLYRKEVCQLLGISQSALTRRMKQRDFPRPIYDAGHPKWRAADFLRQAGQANGHDLSG